MNYIMLFYSFLVFSFFILCLVVASVIVGYNEKEFENLTNYECGFMAFEEARIKVAINFYILAILFIIFDLEIILLFPWIIVLKNMGTFVVYIGFFFIFLITLGLLHEFNVGVLDWYGK